MTLTPDEEEMLALYRLFKVEGTPLPLFFVPADEDEEYIALSVISMIEQNRHKPYKGDLVGIVVKVAEDKPFRYAQHHELLAWVTSVFGPLGQYEDESAPRFPEVDSRLVNH